MRTVPTAVTVVSVGSGEAARGLTIGSFASTSLKPPLVSFNVARDAGAHDLFRPGEPFVVHVLRHDQWSLSERFSDPVQDGAGRFAGVSHRMGPGGLPVLNGVLSVFYCAVRQRYDAGDHSIVVGEVERVEFDERGQPLVYLDQRYGAFAEAGSAPDASPTTMNLSSTSTE